MAAEASPGVPVLVIEDDVQVASFFALRVSKLITDIEVGNHPIPSDDNEGVGTCLPRALQAGDAKHIFSQRELLKMWRKCSGRGRGQELGSESDGKPRRRPRMAVFPRVSAWHSKIRCASK